MTLADWRDTIAVIVSVAALVVTVTMRIQDRKKVCKVIEQLDLDNIKSRECIADAPRRQAMADAELERTKAESKRALAEAERVRLDSDLLRQELNTAEQRVEQLDRQVAELFLQAMSDAMYKNLEKLATGQFGPFKNKPGGGLERELRYLRDTGYVKQTRKTTSISTIPAIGDELSEFVTITDSGRRFVALRQESARRNGGVAAGPD